MSSKPDVVEKKERVGILRKRDTTGSSSASSTTKTAPPLMRAKPALVAHKPPTPIKPAEEGGSIFSKRTKMLRDKPTTAPEALTVRIPPKASISACHSTTTLDSRITATSQSSLSHKPGQLPAYMRNKTGTGSKNLVSVQVQCNKKQFIQVKKDLQDIQNKAVDYYKRYRDSLVKLNKLNGSDEAPVLEDLQIVNFTENVVAVPPPIPSVPETKFGEPIAFNKLKQLSDEKVLGQISQQVESIQVHGFKLLQEFTARLAEINNQMKSSENSESGDTNLFPTKIQNLFEEIEKKIKEEEEMRNSRIISFMTNLKQVMINEEGRPVLMQDDIQGEYENFKKTNELKITEMENKIKELELKKIHEEHKNTDLAKSLAKEQANISELKCVLAQCETKRDEKEKDIERINQKLKVLDLNIKRYEKLLESKANEIALKEKSIAELKSIVKTNQDKLLKMANQNQKMESKVARSEEDSKSQMEQLKNKHQEETKISDQLRKELNEVKASIAQDNKPLRDENEQLKLNVEALDKEIRILKLSLTETMHCKALTDKSKAEEQICRREMERMEEDLKRMKMNIIQLTEEVNIKDNQISKKTREANDLEMMVKQLEQRDRANEYKLEIAQLKDQNTQKTKENDQLQGDLNKALTELRLQEESIFMQQRLLKIRSELIQSLQDNDDTSKTHLTELNAEIDKKAYVVKQLNQEVSSKTEELENLFSTLGAKNLEVKRQDHIIKLLEETHDRNQRVRVKQEEKIARLENENAELKRFIKFKG